MSTVKLLKELLLDLNHVFNDQIQNGKLFVIGDKRNIDLASRYEFLKDTMELTNLIHSADYKSSQHLDADADLPYRINQGVIINISEIVTILLPYIQSNGKKIFY